VQEFRKCIECYLCQDVCHVLRDRDIIPLKERVVDRFYDPIAMLMRKIFG
jgi:succinate dehydrogenase/fumarate reductase-like Fe-S protein